MAGKGKRKSSKRKAEPQVVAIKPSEFQAAIKDASRLKHQAAEYQGFASRGVNAFAKRTGFPTKVFNWLRSLYDIEDSAKRESLIREFLFGCECLGFIAQSDMFNDVQARVDELRKQEAEKPSGNGSGDGLPLDEAQRKFEEAAAASPPDTVQGIADDLADGLTRLGMDPGQARQYADDSMHRRTADNGAQIPDAPTPPVLQ